MGGGMLWFWLLMNLFGLLVFAGLILLAVWALARITRGDGLRSGGSSSAHEDPLVILQRRYARGDIGQEEYQRIRSELLGPRQSE